MGESVQRWCAYKGMSTDIIGPVVVGVGVVREKEEILLTKGIQERREGTAIVAEVGMGAGIGIGAGEGVVEQLNLMAIVVMMGVLVRGGCWEEGQRVEYFIVIKDGLCMFQVLLRHPRVFFSRIFLSSDQEHVGHWSSTVA